MDEEGALPNGMMDKKNEFLANLDVILKCEDIHWGQKAKCKWLQQGDENTTFFHRMANGKNRKNAITKLVIDGETMEDVNKIKEETIQYFSTLYTKEEGPHPMIDNLFSKSLEQEDVDNLEGCFLEEEIKEAVFSMAKDKSPGPDGFSMSFFQECWEFIKGDLLKVFKEFFESDTINLGVNATFLVLILKKESAMELMDFRPISLVTSLYKIIAKVLSWRIRKVIGKVVDVS